jgi:polar amino acid transport system substrate-binding protein
LRRISNKLRTTMRGESVAAKAPSVAAFHRKRVSYSSHHLEGEVPMKRLAMVVGLCSALVIGGFAFAADTSSPTLARIVEKKEVRVGMSGNQPPFAMKSRGGELIGFEVDAANALANAMGVKLELVQKPFSELLPALERGEVDMVMSGMTMTPERSLKFNFAGPYYVSGKSVLTKSKELAKGTQASDFNKKGLVLVALEGSTSQAFVQNVLTDSTLVTAPDYDAAIKMVVSGKAQGLVADLPALVVALARNPNKGLTMAGALLTMEPIGVALPSDDTKLVDFVSSLISAAKSTGRLDARADYWFKGGKWLAELP